MAGTGTDAVATKCTEILIDKAMKELPFLCCYKSYVDDFERKKEELKAAVEKVDMKIKEAKTRNETQIDPIVKHWVQKANNLIQQETRPKKCFGFCTDWFSQYSLAKELESMMQEIPTMIEKAESFSQVARSAESPGLKFYSLDFMHFKSRNLKFEQLRKELKDDNKCRIGLQAMGGSGKTIMAKAVGKELESSKTFDKVLFIEVPNPIDEKKIQDEIAKKLELKLEDDKEKNLTRVEQIWIRIANVGKVLIILDDVWGALNLENIGIHHGIHTQGRCCVLLTTRSETVCTSMRCEEIIKLGVLPEEDAVDLFLHHASESGNDCPNKLKLLASKIVKECGNLPVIVVAVARTFRNWDPNEWEDAFAAIEKDSSLRHGNTDGEAKKFYNSLKISFKCLEARAQDLILLCSIFPRAYEIPVELLSRIAIGLGLCENVDSYCRSRSQVLPIKTKLLNSALLLTTREGYVKMHDVVRDVAQQIGDEKIQVIMDSKRKLKENVKYSSWIINDFSDYFEGNNLEVLLVWVNANGSLEVANTFFGGMKGLKVLLLCSKFEFGRTLALSLPKSIHLLENIQTLSLTNWELGDVSLLQNLKKLQTLELTNCSIIELPNEVSQLEKLRLLGLVCCSIKRNNPFEVIGRCSKLEVLYYISNEDTLNDINAKPSNVTVLPEFGIYHIEGSSSWRDFHLDASTKRYFNSTKLKGIFSESTVKYLTARAEILELTECKETRWTNLIPDMVHPIKDGGMNDLIRLSLKSWPSIQCLIDTKGIQFDATIFPNLVELQLHDMCVRELCDGDFPNDFLKQLEKLDLSHCINLDGVLFKGKLELSKLKFVKLNDCSMTCLFHLSIAQSLKQLENLYIRGCSKLKCLISDDERSIEQKVDDYQDPKRKNHHSMFPKLKFLKVQECHELKFILPIFPCKELESMKVNGCNELKYIFRQCLEEGGLYGIEQEITLPLLQEIEIANVPKFVNIYPECYLPQPSQVQKLWGPLCCLSSKASVLSFDEPSFSKANQLDHTQASKEKHLSRAGGLFTPPLYPYKNLRKMSIEGFSKLKSLLTLSIASSLKVLEELTIKKCGELEHIITDDGHVYNHMNDCFFFSNLKQITVLNVEKLKYVFGQCHSNHKYNVHIELNLPHLKTICLENVPNMVGICTKNYSVKALSLQDISLENCPQLPINIVIDLSIDLQERGEDLSKRKEKGKKEFTCLYVSKASKPKSAPNTAHGYLPPPLYQFNLREIEITRLSELTSLFTISIASSLKLLETLQVKEWDTLEHIIIDEGPNSHGHVNVHSVFPNLKEVFVESCNNLEYVFPAFYSKDIKDLECVRIRKAQKMKYVFGKCHADQNHNVQSKLNLTALKELDLDDVPNMVSICAENYYVEVLHLEDISFEGCPELRQTSIDFLVGGYKRQEDLSRRKALSFKDKGKALSNLQELPDSRDKYVAPKNFLSFRNLSRLRFVGCKQLKFILSASTTRSIPELRSLFLSDCEELVSIIEDDEENQQNPLDPHQASFPKLRIIQVKQCKKLKCLFSITTCAKLPKLFLLEIQDAPDLAQVFEWKQGAPEELVIKDVLPNLHAIRLANLPCLHTIYQGVDFQTVKIGLVRDCNNIPSDNVSSFELFEYVKDSLPRERMNFVDNYYYYYYTQHIIHMWACERQEEETKKVRARDKTISEPNSSTPNLDDNEEESKEAVEKDSTIQKQKSSSPNLTEIEEEGSQEDIGNDSTMPQQNNGSPNVENSKEVSKKIAKKDSTTHKHNSNLSNFTKSTNALANEIVEEKLSTTPSSNSYMSTKTSTNEIVEQQVSTSNTAAIPSSKSDRDNLVHKASSSSHSEPRISNLGTSASTKELCEKESKGDQEAPGKDMSLNEGPPRVKEPTNDLFTKETTKNKKVALAIPPTADAAEMTSPLDPSISAPKKPQIATSTTHTEPKSSQSDLFDISMTTKCPQDLKATFGEGPSLEKYDKASSSTHWKPKIEKPYTLTPPKESMGDQQVLRESISPNEASQRVEEPTNECSSKETSNKMAFTIPPSITTGMTSPPISSTFSPRKPQISTSGTQVEMELGNSAITDQSAQGQIMVNQRETSIDDDLVRLFQIMKDGSDLKVGQPYISKIAAFEDDKVAKAFADIESTLKMDLHQISSSKEHTHHLENALNFLSTHFFEDDPSSHSLIRGKIDTLHKEIQRILSSFKQASDTIDTFTKLKEKEKWVDEQHSQKMEAATTLVSEILNTEDYMIELKEQISRLQAELKSKEKEFEDCEIKLSCLQKQKKECVLDTIGFMQEYEAVKKDKSYVVDDQTKAWQGLKKVENQWPSCVADLRKIALMLRILLQQKP